MPPGIHAQQYWSYSCRVITSTPLSCEYPHYINVSCSLMQQNAHCCYATTRLGGCYVTREAARTRDAGIAG